MAITGWLSNNWVEVAGVILALVYLILEIKQRWTMWPVGIVSSSLYVVINYEANLYALTGLNACYVIMSSYGLYRWKLAKKADENSLQITRITLHKGWILGGISVGLFALISYILCRFTDSPAPYADALVASLSIVGTWMTAHKILEHWLVWIFVNYFTVGLYIYVGKYPTAILFLIYGSMSIVGWYSWKKMMKQ